jgi:hypothetical protein
MLYDHYMLKNSKNNKSPKISLFYTILVFESNVNEDYYHIYSILTRQSSNVTTKKQSSNLKGKQLLCFLNSLSNIIKIKQNKNRNRNNTNVNKAS